MCYEFLYIDKMYFFIHIFTFQTIKKTLANPQGYTLEICKGLVTAVPPCHLSSLTKNPADCGTSGEENLILDELRYYDTRSCLFTVSAPYLI